MTISDEIEMYDKSSKPSLGRSVLSGLVKLVLFLVIQGLAVMLVGIIALFFSFQPAWSAEGPFPAPVKPGNARSGSLLLKTDDGYAEAVRLGIDVVEAIVYFHRLFGTEDECCLGQAVGARGPAGREPRPNS